MALPGNRTKIVCTIGPASDSQDILERLIRVGMNVARINFSHGDFGEHQAVIRRIRAASCVTGRRVAIMADLPGPKIRIGRFAEEPVDLRPGEIFSLTTQEIEGTVDRVSVTFRELPQAVRPGDRLFLNDGLIQLKVLEATGPEVRCEVLIGGQLSSRKGLNLPGIDLGISAFTDYDRHCLAFALANGVDAISQSFVQDTADITAVRKAAADLGYDPFLIAKIERSGALDHADDILQAADGIMVARGDLGVEIPIAQIAIVQKQLIWKANRLGKPVITATQMLESMTANRRPTRAEATDVANAVLDGSDAVMLSGESAVGLFPVDAAEMLATIAANIEPLRTVFPVREAMSARDSDEEASLPDLIARSVVATSQRITPAAVIVPTHSGGTARRITRFRLPVWITAVSSYEKTCQDLIFSYGVFPVCEPDHPTDWRPWIRNWLKVQELSGHLVVMTEGPSRKHPERNNRMEIVDLRNT
ncbi:MAG: pyruvate kinase [Deltaproteobacteria bacterium]|nr:pyruvate kinase [Deltaproteobacteria bacterium]